MGLVLCRVACLACVPAGSLVFPRRAGCLGRTTTGPLAPDRVHGTASYLVSKEPGVPKCPGIVPMRFGRVFRARIRLLAWWRPSFHLVLVLLGVVLRELLVLVLVALPLDYPFQAGGRWVWCDRFPLFLVAAPP